MNGLKQVGIALATVGLLASGTAQAALTDRGGGLIYDTVLNITWLKDILYAATQYELTGGAQGDADGRMNWSAADTWAKGLTISRFAGESLTGWRLPTALNQDHTGPCPRPGPNTGGAYYCSNSEMGHMFYNNMGASANFSILLGTNTANLALFTNLRGGGYWSGTVLETAPDTYAWGFWNESGFQGYNGQAGENYAWAVRAGDVAAVPEPEVYALLLGGLGLLGVVAKRRRRSFGAS